MAIKIKRVRGMQDIIAPQTVRWQYVENIALQTAECFGLTEIRVPTLEKTELFLRSVGETTDVVQKEMYTFDMGRESLTMRPEGTAGVVRAVLENGMLNDILPLKLCYITNCFRHEKPQAGRYREFRQFGVEIFGSAEPAQDAEVISIAAELLNRLGIKEVELQINSIGCPNCRPDYHKKLTEYYSAHYEKLCDTCKQRLEKNPLRLLDCKEESCIALKDGAPRSIDNLCTDCEDHFAGLKESLAAINIDFSVNPDIVRGLDYYSRTVFEFVSTKIGAQGTVCGGGRYDSLIEMMGGQPVPALGFGMGLERILMVMEQEGCDFPDIRPCDLYIGSMGKQENLLSQNLAFGLRKQGFSVAIDTMNRSVKAQMKYADKLKAKYSCIIGSNEMAENNVTIKNMADGKTAAVELTEKAFTDFFFDRFTDEIIEMDL